MAALPNEKDDTLFMTTSSDEHNDDTSNPSSGSDEDMTNHNHTDSNGTPDNNNTAPNTNTNTNTNTNENTNENNDEKTLHPDNIDITKIDKDERPLRIYLDGVFDMTHYGHFRLFKSVKDKFPNATIIVGVSGDEETIRLKGQTLMNQSERAESVSHCKWVDEVICPCPWIITQEFIDAQNIDYVAHDGAAYVSAGANDIYDFVKKQGKFIATQRTEGISTTGLINRIVRRYNEFVLRNIKRGVKREDLNVSWTRQKRIEMGAIVREVPNAVKHKSGELMDNVATWIHDPNTFVDMFTSTFNRNFQKVKQNVKKYKEDFVEYAQYAPM